MGRQQLHLLPFVKFASLSLPGANFCHLPTGMKDQTPHDDQDSIMPYDSEESQLHIEVTTDAPTCNFADMKGQWEVLRERNGTPSRLLLARISLYQKNVCIYTWSNSSNPGSYTTLRSYHIAAAKVADHQLKNPQKYAADHRFKCGLITTRISIPLTTSALTTTWFTPWQQWETATVRKVGRKWAETEGRREGALFVSIGLPQQSRRFGSRGSRSLQGRRERGREHANQTWDEV